MELIVVIAYLGAIFGGCVGVLMLMWEVGSYLWREIVRATR